MPARRGQGQWALGYREPLNPNERSKRDNDGLAVRQRIIDIYQHPEMAEINQVVAAPTLLKMEPEPVRRIIGHLSNEARVLRGLDLSAVE